jgi:hypothetical protein
MFTVRSAEPFEVADLQIMKHGYQSRELDGYAVGTRNLSIVLDREE